MNFKLSAFLFCIAYTGFFSCNSGPKYDLSESQIIYLHNPSEETIHFKINDEEIKLAPKTDAYPKQLPFGTYGFEFGELKDSFLVIKNSNLLINPLKDTLIAQEIVYLSQGMDESDIAESDYSLEFNMFNIHGLSYYGALELRSELFIKDWVYGPSHPVSKNIYENTYGKGLSGDKSAVIKIHTIPEFVESYISLNHTEAIIEEVLPQFLHVLSDEIIVNVLSDNLYAGTKEYKANLAEIHVTQEEKIALEIWEAYDPAIHGDKLETKFTISDCSIVTEDGLLEGQTVHGTNTSKGEAIVLIVE